MGYNNKILKDSKPGPSWTYRI